MKLLLLCVLAASCCFVAGVTAKKTEKEKKLQEVLNLISQMNQSLQHNEALLLNTPPQNIEDCCQVSALRCFHKNLKYLKVAEKYFHVKLQRSLKHSLTEKSLDFCNQGTVEPTTCQNCTTYPQANAKEFVLRLRSFIEEALTKMRMN